MKIIVFGASGDAGTYFIKYLFENGFTKENEVIAVGTRKTTKFELYKIEYLQLDITQKNEFEKLPQSVDAVVDLAGMMPARMKGYEPQRYIDVNITGTLNILDYCRSANADRILFTQSFGDIKEYSEKNPLLTVNLPRRFAFNTDHTIYVMSKNFAVDMIKNYHELYGIKSFIFRLPSIYLYSPIDTYYADGEPRKIGYRLLINRAIAGEPIEVWGDASRVKDMVYVKDFCQMLYKALFVDRDSGYYNVGTGVGTSLLDQIQGMIDVFGTPGKKSEIIMRPDKPNAPQYIMDITPAVEELEYNPQYDYLTMLKDMKYEMYNHIKNGGGGINKTVLCLPVWLMDYRKIFFAEAFENEI